MVNIEGDPDHPINQGSLCSKGGMAQLNMVEQVNRRVRKPHVPRARLLASGRKSTGTGRWTEIARRIKDTRDANLIETDAEGRTVNRLEAIASWAARRWTTKNARSSSRRCDRWAWCTSNTRRAYDTPLLLRLWQSRSVEEQ